MDRGSWRHLLIRAGALLLAVVVPLVSVRATWWVLRWLAFRTASIHLAAGALILCAISFAALVPHPIDRLRTASAWRVGVRVVVVAVIGFVALTVATGISLLIVVAPFGLATFSAALAEEAVFRRHLPDWLSSTLRRTGTAQRVSVLATLLVTQLTFAVAHAENSSFSAAGPREFAILFLTGVLYFGIARVGGLWAAAAFHAALNLTIAIAGYRG